MSQRKLGERIVQRMVELGMNEVRNAAAFENSNVVDDIRRTSHDPQQEMHHYHHPSPQDQQQDQSLEQQQEL